MEPLHTSTKLHVFLPAINYPATPTPTPTPMATTTSTLLPNDHNAVVKSIEQTEVKPVAAVEGGITEEFERVAAYNLLKANANMEPATTAKFSHRVVDKQSDNELKAAQNAGESDASVLGSQNPMSEDDDSNSSTGGSKEDPIDIDDSPPILTAEQPRKPKGRSHGDRSNKHIKDLRTAATKGSIEAALKLGWSVERLTALYNRRKASKGIPTTEDEPIDDPELLARIEQRKEHGREATKRRTDKLKARVAIGDHEAAKKLGLGKKTMEALFPNLTKDPLVSDNVSARQMRGRTPSEPQDFVHDNGGVSNLPITDRVKAIVDSRTHKPSRSVDRLSTYQPSDGIMPAYAPGAFHGHPQNMGAAASWGNMRSWEQMYSMPPPQFQIEIQLQTAYDEAKRLAAIANQRAVDLGDKLKRYRDYQERFGVAMYEAMTKAADKLSVRDKHGSGRGMGHPIAPFAMMSDSARREE